MNRKEEKKTIYIIACALSQRSLPSPSISFSNFRPFLSTVDCQTALWILNKHPKKTEKCFIGSVFWWVHYCVCDFIIYKINDVEFVCNLCSCQTVFVVVIVFDPQQFHKKIFLMHKNMKYFLYSKSSLFKPLNVYLIMFISKEIIYLCWTHYSGLKYKVWARKSCIDFHSFVGK